MKRGTVVLIAVLAYVFGIATPYVLPYGLTTILGVGDEISRTTSPDGTLDAVVIGKDPGAFSSVFYYLYLVPKGARVTSIDASLMRTVEGDELKASWEKAHFLEVDPGNAHVQSFANLWYSRKLPDYYVQLDLKKDPTKNYLKPDGKLRIGE